MTSLKYAKLCALVISVLDGKTVHQFSFKSANVIVVVFTIIETENLRLRLRLRIRLAKRNRSRVYGYRNLPNDKLMTPHLQCD